MRGGEFSLLPPHFVVKMKGKSKNPQKFRALTFRTLEFLWNTNHCVSVRCITPSLNGSSYAPVWFPHNVVFLDIHQFIYSSIHLFDIHLFINSPIHQFIYSSIHLSDKDLQQIYCEIMFLNNSSIHQFIFLLKMYKRSSVGIRSSTIHLFINSSIHQFIFCSQQFI